MTIGHTASSFLQSTAYPDSASHDSRPFRCATMDACCDSLQHVPSVPNLSGSTSCGTPPLILTVQTVVGHYAMLWYAPAYLGVPPNSFESPRDLDTDHSSSLGALLEVARARTIVAELVEAVNAKAKFSVRERSDVIIMHAENQAARNMFRAYSGLIRARIAEVFDVTDPHRLERSLKSPARGRSWRNSLADAHQTEVVLSESGSATHARAPTRAWDDIARDADVLEKEIQRSIDRYHKWLVEMCQRTADLDPGASGERIGRLRRRRDREFNRLMYRYSALS